MDWFSELMTGTSIAHAVLVLSGVVALGVLLSRIKICGVSLGVTWILFVGIVAGHFGLSVNADILNFIKEFGLILFVYLWVFRLARVSSLHSRREDLLLTVWQ